MYATTKLAAPYLVIWRTLAREPGTNQILVTVTVANGSPNPVAAVRITGGSLTVGAVTTTTRLPAALGTLAPGASQSVVLRFPASDVPPGASVLLRTPGAHRRHVQQFRPGAFTLQGPCQA